MPPTTTDLAPGSHSAGLWPSGAMSNCGSSAAAIPQIETYFLACVALHALGQARIRNAVFPSDRVGLGF